MGEEPENEGQQGTQQKTSDNRKVERGVFATMDDVARESSQPERQPIPEIKQDSEEHEEATKDEKSAAELAERLHQQNCSEGRDGKEVGR